MTDEEQPLLPDTSCDGPTGDWSEFPDNTGAISAANNALERANHRALTAFATGVLVGGIFALLVAPREGRTNRRWLAERGRIIGRRTVILMHRDELMAIVRKSGVVGLVGWRRRYTDAALPPQG